MIPTNRLKRVIAPGEALVFDSGRITVRLVERTGQCAALVIEMAADVLLAPPPRKGMLTLPAARINPNRKR